MATYAQVSVKGVALQLDRPFDYVIPEPWVGLPGMQVGAYVEVPFHGQTKEGWVTAIHTDPQVDPAMIKRVSRLLTPYPVAGAGDLAAWRWIADRFLGSFASVARLAMTPIVAFVHRELATWAAPPCAPSTPIPDGGQAFYIQGGWHQALPGAVADRIQHAVDAGYQIKIITPLPACALSQAVAQRWGPLVDDMRWPTPNAQRYRSFWRWRLGYTKILLTTQHGALWAGGDGRLGLTIVVDEAKADHKVRRRPYANAREMALVTTRTHGAQVILTGHLPSAQVTGLITANHVAHLQVSRQVMAETSPPVHVVDRATLIHRRRGRITEPVMTAIREAVDQGGRVIVLCAMKGSGKALACKRCRHRCACPICGGGLNRVDPSDPIASTHQADPSHPGTGEGAHGPVDASQGDGGEVWHCGICQWTGRPLGCETCGGTVFYLSRAGVALIAKELAATFPTVEVAVMEGYDADGPAGRPAIAVMTRGSVTSQPAWLAGGRADLLAIVDPEVMVGRTSVDASEDALRLWMDGASLADRVIIQSHEPTHPAIQALALHAPERFWDEEMERRTSLGYPPARRVIELVNVTLDQVDEVRAYLADRDEVTVMGPDLHGHALIFGPDLQVLIAALRPLALAWETKGQAVGIVVDPIDR